jgi:hypothetical protein
MDANREAIDKAALERRIEEMKFAALDKEGLSRSDLDRSVEDYKNRFVTEVLTRQGKELEEVVNRPAKPAVSKFRSFWYRLGKMLF